MTQPPPDLATLSPSEKDALLLALVGQVKDLLARVAALEAENAALEAENAALKAENAALREKRGQPPKTPRNSSTPPSRGQKPNAAFDTKANPKGKAHPGAHRPLHPKPDRRVEVRADHCPHCEAAVNAVNQRERHAYDRIDIPGIKPDVTRVTLFGETCPCCQKGFTAPGAGRSGTGFAVRPQPAGDRALSARGARHSLRASSSLSEWAGKGPLSGALWRRRWGRPV